MILSRAWLIELGVLTLYLAGGFLGGYLMGEITIGLFLALLAYALYQIFQLHRLETWLCDSKKKHPRGIAGAWSQVYGQISALQHRNRKRKRKLAQHLKRFQESTSALPDAVVVVDKDNQIEWLNGAATRILGLRIPDDIGHRIDSCIEHPAFIRYLKAADNDDPVEISSPLDADRTLSLRTANFGKNQRLLIARDVSRLYHLLRMRRDFVANVSHEMRTPLTVIIGYMETLRGKEHLCDENWRSSLESIDEHAGRMHRLVEDLLLLSQLETEDASATLQQPVSIAAIVSEAMNEARALSGGQHEIHCENDGDLWLTGDEQQLCSAFSNLVSNAIRYTPAGGEIHVRSYQDEEGAHFSVRDSGVGIPAEHIPRITERFYRVDVSRSRQSGGTGLGLAIVKHTLINHDAGLRISSAPREGSTFICDFPMNRVTKAAQDPASLSEERSDELLSEV